MGVWVYIAPRPLRAFMGVLKGQIGACLKYRRLPKRSKKYARKNYKNSVKSVIFRGVFMGGF